MKVIAKKNKKIIKLSVKVSLLFALITLVIMGLLVLTTLLILSNVFSNLNSAQLEYYYAGVHSDYQKQYPISSDGRFNSLLFFEIENKSDNYQRKIKHHLTHNDTVPKEQVENKITTLMYAYIDEEEKALKPLNIRENRKFNFTVKVKGNTYFITGNLKKIYDGSEAKLYEVLLAYTANDFIKNLQRVSSLVIILISTIASFLLFVLSFLWTRHNITKRVQKLSNATGELLNTNFKKEIGYKGNDEIANLAQSINVLRQEILIKETEKQEMLQNISHDIKNPIAIIRSYAEAIEDGVSDISSVSIIKEKSIEIATRVNQLLSFIKFNYNKTNVQKDIINYNVKELMVKLANENKFRFKGEFEVIGDNSEYSIYLDEFLVAIQNILDNALRYAKSIIKIEIKEKFLTIYNDGKEINEDLIKEIFTPYKMGSDGQFGLGMGITKAILNNYALDIKVINDNGVKFIIGPM